MATPRLVRTTLAGADGGPLRVDVRSGARPGEGRPAAVICHGFKGFKDWGFFPKLAERLATAGFTALSFNFSGSGVGAGMAFDERERWFHQKPSADLQDLSTVVEHAWASLAATWVGLVGHSRGGALAILHASRDPRVGALVTWAAIDHFLRFSEAELVRWRHQGRLDVVNQRTGDTLPMGLDSLQDVERHQGDLLDVPAAAARCTKPWLIVHGTADRTVPVEAAERLAAASGSPSSKTLLIEGAEHTFGVRHPWAGSTPDFDRVRDATVGFLAENIR